MKLVNINFFSEENVKIEDNIFCFSSDFDEITSEFVIDLIKENFNKSLEELNDDDIKNVVDVINKLNVSKILYSIIGLLNNYSLTDTYDDATDLKTINVIKILKYFNLYREIILCMTEAFSYDTDIEKNEDAKKKIENFEKEYNISIIVESTKIK